MPSTRTRRQRATKMANDEVPEKAVKAKRKLPESPAKMSKAKQVKKELSPLKERMMGNKIKEDEEMDTHSDSDSDGSTELGSGASLHAEIMKRREENIRMNQEFFKQLGISEAKDAFAISAQKKRPSDRGLKREKKPKEILPRRSSLRLQNKTPEGCELPPEALIRQAYYTPYEPEQHLRPPAGPLPMCDHLFKTTTEEEHQAMVKLVTNLDVKPLKPATEDLDKYISRMRNLSLREDRVAKVVPERTFSVTLHPAADRVLAATGDKWGKIGLWNVVSDHQSSSDGVCCYAPHSRPVTCLEFPINEPHRLYSCGYDGSLRCGDMNSEKFDEIYSVPEEDDVLLRNFNFTSPHTMLVSRNDGCVAMVDTRTKGVEAEEVYDLHNRSLRTVSVHPLETHYLCTGGVDGLLRVWDLRKLKKKGNKHLAEMTHGRSINSAFFSPVTGKHILSTCMDDTLRVFDSSVIGSGIKEKKSIRHNNHTGRWLTLFRAMWHPVRDDVFVVGSMSRPREIELFNAEGKKLHSYKNEDYLGSICSLNALHPTRDIVVGANSSGRLHVFM